MGQVVTYKNDEQKGMYCLIKLDSGERIFICIADRGMKIYKMGFGGLIPTKTIWESKDMSELVAQFFDTNDIPDILKHPLDAAKDRLINCASVEEVKRVLGIQ